MVAGAASGRITQGSIDAVLQRSDLVDLAGGYTQLHKRGAEHSGRCPFHEERTPSFWVNGTKGVYHCFGCGASGDVISFVQAKQGLDFVETIELLADRYRVDLEYEGNGGKGAAPRQSKRRLYELMDAAAAFYETSLWGAASAAEAREYLASRHISQETARAFRIGYSPEGGLLVAKARKRGFSDAELNDAGLSTANGTDFFRGRLMVPIVDRADRVLGFGARKLREEQFGGKYVNSRTGPLFDKSRTVYMAPAIATAAKAANSVVMVEGYMDVIAMWQAGFHNSCAVMGTALTDDQVTELKRLAPRAMFALDPDPAGQAATLRALTKAQAQELDVRVVLLPEGEDPADVLLEGGGTPRMTELLDAGVSLLHFRTSALLGSGDLTDSAERDRIYTEAVELFRAMPDGPEPRAQIGRVGNALQLDTDTLHAMYGSLGAEGRVRMTRQDSREPRFRDEREVARRVATTRPRSTAIVREKRLLAVALRLAERDPAAAALGETLPPEEAFGLAVHRRARTALIEGGAEALAPARVRAAEDEELFALVAELATLAERDRVGAEDPATTRETVVELSRKVELQHLERTIGELTARLGTADEIADESVLEELAAAKARRRELDPRA